MLVSKCGWKGEICLQSISKGSAHELASLKPRHSVKSDDTRTMGRCAMYILAETRGV